MEEKLAINEAKTTQRKTTIPSSSTPAATKAQSGRPPGIRSTPARRWLCKPPIQKEVDGDGGLFGSQETPIQHKNQQHRSRSKAQCQVATHSRKAPAQFLLPEQKGEHHPKKNLERAHQRHCKLRRHFRPHSIPNNLRIAPITRRSTRMGPCSLKLLGHYHLFQLVWLAGGSDTLYSQEYPGTQNGAGSSFAAGSGQSEITTVIRATCKIP